MGPWEMGPGSGVGRAMSSQKMKLRGEGGARTPAQEQEVGNIKRLKA